MAVVPSPSVPSVAPTGSSGTPYQSAAGATPDAFGASIGQAEQGLGRTIEGLGDVMAKHAMKMQEDLNVSHAEDLFLNGSVELGTLQEKYKSLEGAARVNALPKFMEDAAAIRAKYKDAAPNPDVDKKFDQLFTRQLGYAVREAGGLAGQANRQYQRDTSKAVQANSMSEIAKAAEDDGQFLYQTDTALKSMRNQPDYQGASPEVKQEMDRSLVTGAWATRLQAMSKTEPLRARDLFEKNKASIDGNAQLKLKPIIDQGIIVRDTKVASDKIISDLGTGSMEERLKKFEGYDKRAGGQWDYKQQTSGYGTKVQPGDENLAPDQLKAVHEQRLKNDLGAAYNVVDSFAPGLAKGARDALIDLTFNAGSQWTHEGLGRAVQEGNMEKAKELFSQYVNVTEKDGSKHPLKVLQDRRATGLSWWNNETGPAIDSVQLHVKALEQAKERAVKTFPNEPENQAAYLDTLQQTITKDYRVMDKAARDMQLQLRSIVSGEIDSKKVTNVSQMTPEMQDRYFSGSTPLRNIWDKQMDNISKADVPRTAERSANWDKWYGMEWEQAMAVNLDSWDLTKADKARGIRMQMDQDELIKRGAKIAPAMKAMDGELHDARITKDTDDYFKFKGAYEQALNREMQNKKRELTPDEERAVGKTLVKDTVTSHHWWRPDSTDRSYRVIADSVKNPITLRSDDADAHFNELPRGANFIGPGETKPRIKQ